MLLTAQTDAQVAKAAYAREETVEQKAKRVSGEARALALKHEHELRELQRAEQESSAAEAKAKAASKRAATIKKMLASLDAKPFL
jgi:hypothetical protein